MSDRKYFSFSTDKYQSATFYNRLTLIEKEFPGAAVLLHKNGVLPKVTLRVVCSFPVNVNRPEGYQSMQVRSIEHCVLQAYQDLWTNDRLLNCVEQMIGPDIAGHPVWNLRTKVQNEKLLQSVFPDFIVWAIECTKFDLALRPTNLTSCSWGTCFFFQTPKNEQVTVPWHQGKKKTNSES